MKSILKFIRGVFVAFVYFTLGMFAVYFVAVVVSSGYESRVVDGEIKRAWHVRLPGYEEYLDIDSNPLVHRRRFIMRAYYRVGPWFDPDPAVREEPECKP
jgi:hypothetical protein